MLLIRRALTQDTPSMGELYVRVWQDTYPGLIPNETLLAMCPQRAADRWQAVLSASGHGRGALVAEDASLAAGQDKARGTGLIGLGSFGPNQDRDLPYDAEVFTLYVDPDHSGRGVGTALIETMFESMIEARMTSALVWTLSLNPHRFFYRALGAKHVARKMDQIAGMPVELSAFAWDDITTLVPGAVAAGQEDLHS